MRGSHFDYTLKNRDYLIFYLMSDCYNILHPDCSQLLGIAQFKQFYVDAITFAGVRKIIAINAQF